MVKDIKNFKAKKATTSQRSRISKHALPNGQSMERTIGGKITSKEMPGLKHKKLSSEDYLSLRIRQCHFNILKFVWVSEPCDDTAQTVYRDRVHHSDNGPTAGYTSTQVKFRDQCCYQHIIVTTSEHTHFRRFALSRPILSVKMNNTFSS